MTQELALSHYSRQWLGRVATSAKLTPTRSGQRWLLHLTPDSPPARTVTLQVRWSGVQWQLLSLTNAEDWRTMNQAVDELGIDPKRRCFWHCQAGPEPLSEPPRTRQLSQQPAVYLYSSRLYSGNRPITLRRYIRREYR